MCNHESKVPSRLSPQWPCGSSCTWAHNLWLKKHSANVHHVPKCISCHKAIVMITGRAHYFHDNIYIMPILFLSGLFEQSVCRSWITYHQLYIFIYIYIYIYI